MVDRTDREVCLDRIDLKSQHINDARASLSSWIITFDTWIGTLDEGSVKDCFGIVGYCLKDNRDAIMFYLDIDVSYEPKWLIAYFLRHHTIAEAEAPEDYDLTWEKIVGAWLVATGEGQMWTIGMIDYMRKEIWDKPFSFPLISGMAGGT